MAAVMLWPHTVRIYIVLPYAVPVVTLCAVLCDTGVVCSSQLYTEYTVVSHTDME